MFYRPTGLARLSGAADKIRLEPGSGVRFDTAFNILGLGALQSACRLDRLALGLTGSGQLEVSVCHLVSGGAVETLVRGAVTLLDGVETILDLSQAALTPSAGTIWVELRAIDPQDTATLNGGRFLTATQPDPAFRLAVCRPVHAEDDARDPFLARLQDWAAQKSGQVAVFGPAQGPAHAAQLAEARLQNYTHALLLNADTIVDCETLDRAMVLMSLAKSPKVAFGAALVDRAERALLVDNGLIRSLDGTLSPVDAGANPNLASTLLRQTPDGDASGPAVARTNFLGMALADLPKRIDTIFQSARLGPEMITLIEPGLFDLHHVPGIMIRRDPARRRLTGLMTLQNMIFPEQGICTEEQMFFHATGNASYCTEAQPVFDATGTRSHVEQVAEITIADEDAALFDTYFNALSIGKWHETCALDGLWLGVSGRGRVEIKVFHAIPDRSWEMLASQIVTLSRGHEAIIDLSHYAHNATRGVIYFEAKALGDGVAITGSRYMTAGAPDPDRKLALSITTFKREEQVENTARRLSRYLETAEFSEFMHCYIVDNGNSAKIVSHPQITRIPNANLGGAGGFTRGLLEAEAAGYSHVLFMDDDASIPMEALHRTYAFLTLSKDPKAAIAGAMINNTDKWRMWENGAVFDRKCKPLFTGTDLRTRDGLLRMEFSSAATRPAKMYGGWWYFAFPVAQVKRHPFPFFVRGDDVNFSLVNEFNINTLNGVVSFADDFIDKESPLTWYLDLRSHMVHHLTLDKMEVGGRRVAGIAVKFFLRNLVKFQYETIEAILMAWEHVLQGPDFFVDNADASGPRAAIKALVKTESWKPVADFDMVGRKRWFDRWPSLRRRFFPFALNGHVLPFFGLWGSRVVIPSGQRGHLDAVWGASRLIFLNSTRDKAYATQISYTKALSLTLRLIGLWLRTVLGYGKLRALYHKRYPEITTPGYWHKALAMPDTAVASEPAPVAPAAIP